MFASHFFGHKALQKQPAVRRTSQLTAFLLLSSLCERTLSFSPTSTSQVLVPIRYDRTFSIVSGSSSRDDLESMTVPALKEQLRSLGRKVGGRKSELVDRVLSCDDTANPSSLSYDTPRNIDELAYDRVPDSAVVILACKSCGLFQRSALALQSKLQDIDPSILVFGHPRGKSKSAWNPIDLKAIPGETKSATKGVFEVRKGGVDGGKVILTIGPELRPFSELRAANMGEIADKIIAALKC